MISLQLTFNLKAENECAGRFLENMSSRTYTSALHNVQNNASSSSGCCSVTSCLRQSSLTNNEQINPIKLQRVVLFRGPVLAFAFESSMDKSCQLE